MALYPRYFEELRVSVGKTCEKAEGRGPCRVPGPPGLL